MGSGKRRAERPMAYPDWNTTSPAGTKWPVGRTSSSAAIRGKSGMAGYRRSTSLTTISRYGSRPSSMSSKVMSRSPSTSRSSAFSLSYTRGCSAMEYRAAVSVLPVVSCPAPITSWTSSQSSSAVRAGLSSVSSTPRRSLGAGSPRSSALRRSWITGVTISRISFSCASRLVTPGSLIFCSTRRMGRGVMKIFPIKSPVPLMVSSSRSSSSRALPWSSRSVRSSSLKS
mmetsp:Transcript_13833/g.25222  ORF Transcript_13833/g.25222 Transcript_13833/m.25222 type:complete len:228 (-) Transcript_13833:1228-1911(-)